MQITTIRRIKEQHFSNLVFTISITLLFVKKTTHTCHILLIKCNTTFKLISRGPLYLVTEESSIYIFNYAFTFL